MKESMKIRVNYDLLDAISYSLRGAVEVNNGREFGVYLSYVLRVPYKCIGTSIRMNASVQEIFKFNQNHERKA